MCWMQKTILEEDRGILATIINNLLDPFFGVWTDLPAELILSLALKDFFCQGNLALVEVEGLRCLDPFSVFRWG